jgi:Uma2 family endonuclease
MAALIMDPDVQRRMIARRRRLGIDHWDEVWDGVYVMAPAADNQHFEVAADLLTVLVECVRRPGLGRVMPGINISDRKEGWRKNFRCPDVTVFLTGTAAEDCGKFWYGGPDFAIEIVSPHDRTRKKIPFYEKVGTRELLIVDRRPWQLTHFCLLNGKLCEVGRSTFEAPSDLRSAVVPLTFRLVGDASKPAILIRHHDGKQQWTVKALQSKK